MQKHPNFQTNKLNKQNVQPIKASSHFLGLQCVLDKYQHQNEILSQKVSFLIQQNKRLRLGSSYNHSGDYIKYEKGLVKYKQNYQSLLRHTNTTDLKNTLNKLQKQTYNIKSYELDKQQSIYRNKNKIEYDNITKTSRKQKKQQQQYRQQYKQKNLTNITNQIYKQNQRKSSLSLQKYNRDIINNRHSSNDQKQTQRYSYRNVNVNVNNNNNRIKTQPNINIANDKQTTANANVNKNISIINNNKKIISSLNNKQSNNQIMKKQTNKQSINQINRQAYLQDQTIFLDSQDISIQENKDNQKIRINNHNNTTNNITNKNKQIDYEKLPIFIQASFGNLDEKYQDSGNSNSNSDSNYNYNQSQKQYQYRYNNQNQNQNLNKNQKQKQNENKIKKQFSIQSLQNQLKQKNKDFLKSNFRLDKTQQQKKSFFLPPYLTSDLKTQQEPSYLQKQKQNIQITSGKKTNSPYIKSDYKLTQPKTQLAKILHNQRKKQQVKYQVKYQVKQQQQQFLDNVVQPSSTKKTFINVISRKPKIKIFLK